MAADFVSPTIDFRDSSHCAVQVMFSGLDVFTGAFSLYGSLLRDPASFPDNDIAQSLYVVQAGKVSKMWIFDRLSFRYMQLWWTANATAAGTVSIWAQGKKV